MKRITFLITLFFLAITSMFAQEGLTITGVVADDTGVPLLGADVMIKGTTNGTVTNFDGEFELTAKADEGVVLVSYIGYISQEVPYSKSSTNINVVLKASSLGLQEVMIVASVAIDRKTPVAVSTLKKAEIQRKLGNQEFVEVLKSTPGVYTTKGGGGFGDGEITMRGFNSVNVAVMINGIPVNDMENGQVYWSNWAGLGNVTSTIQTQRGLGAAKIAVPSIGGTINTITETVDAEKGGLVKAGVGNDGYTTYGLKLSTGLSENGFAATIYADRTYGNGYVDGTEFSGISYFVNLTKKFNDRHTLAFNAFGAQQKHGQRQDQSSIQTYRQSESGIKYNPNWGYKNGEVYHVEDNYYHKPQISLSHYWNVNDNNKLSTSVYYSRGTGGGGGTAGEEDGKLAGTLDGESYRIGTLGPLDIDRIVEENIENGSAGATAIKRNSVNNHTWIGMLSTLTSTLSDDLDLTTGLDLRYYRGEHYREVDDLLGGQYYADDSDVNSSSNVKQVGDKISYHNDGEVFWGGALGQLEYDYENLSAFVAGNISNTSYRRIDYFQIPDSEDQSTDLVSFIGFGAKGGANFRLDENHNIFTNIGYFERAPFFDTIWPNFNNDDQNDDAVNQKIFSVELGYGYRSEKLSANVNIYRTEWNDRTEVYSFTEQDDDGNDLTYFANLLGVNALHQGMEFDFEYRPCDKFTVTGMLSYGDWNWTDNLTNVNVFDDDRELVDVVNIFIKDTPVGKSAQTTSALGVSYDLTDDTNFRVDYNYFDRYYADFDPSDRTTEGVDPWKVPDYYTFDVSLLHNFKFGQFDASITATINNFLNEDYISDADDTNGFANGATVYYGTGRTFSISSIINF